MKEISLTKQHNILYQKIDDTLLEYILLPQGQRARTTVTSEDLEHTVLKDCLITFPEFILEVLEAIK